MHIATILGKSFNYLLRPSAFVIVVIIIILADLPVKNLLIKRITKFKPQAIAVTIVYFRLFMMLQPMISMCIVTTMQQQLLLSIK